SRARTWPPGCSASAVCSTWLAKSSSVRVHVPSTCMPRRAHRARWRRRADAARVRVHGRGSIAADVGVEPRGKRSELAPGLRDLALRALGAQPVGAAELTVRGQRLVPRQLAARMIL